MSSIMSDNEPEAADAAAAPPTASAASRRAPPPPPPSSSRPSINFAELTIRTLDVRNKNMLDVAVIPSRQPPERASRRGEPPAPPSLILAQTAVVFKRDEWNNLGSVWTSDAFRDVNQRLWRSNQAGAVVDCTRQPAGLHFDVESEQLLVGGRKAITFIHGASLDGVARDEEPSITTYKAPGRGAIEAPPAELTLATTRWAQVQELYDARSGDGSILAVTRASPENDKTVTEARTKVYLIQGPPTADSRVILIYDRTMCEAENFVPLTDHRMIVQTGIAARWSRQHVLQYDSVLQSHVPIDRRLKEINGHQREIEFGPDQCGANNEDMVQLPDGTLIIAERTRLLHATLQMEESVARISILQTSGGGRPRAHGDRYPGDMGNLDGPISTATFFDLSVLFLEQGALLLFDRAGLLRLAYDRSYRHAAYFDARTELPQGVLTKVRKLLPEYLHELSTRADDVISPGEAAKLAAAEAAAKKSAERARLQADARARRIHRRRDSSPPADQEDDEDEEKDPKRRTRNRSKAQGTKRGRKSQEEEDDESEEEEEEEEEEEAEEEGAHSEDEEEGEEDASYRPARTTPQRRGTGTIAAAAPAAAAASSRSSAPHGHPDDHLHQRSGDEFAHLRRGEFVARCAVEGWDSAVGTPAMKMYHRARARYERRMKKETLVTGAPPAPLVGPSIPARTPGVGGRPVDRRRKSKEIDVEGGGAPDDDDETQMDNPTRSMIQMQMPTPRKPTQPDQPQQQQMTSPPTSAAAARPKRGRSLASDERQSNDDGRREKRDGGGGDAASSSAARSGPSSHVDADGDEPMVSAPHLAPNRARVGSLPPHKRQRTHPGATPGDAGNDADSAEEQKQTADSSTMAPSSTTAHRRHSLPTDTVTPGGPAVPSSSRGGLSGTYAVSSLSAFVAPVAHLDARSAVDWFKIAEEERTFARGHAGQRERRLNMELQQMIEPIQAEAQAHRAQAQANQRRAAELRRQAAELEDDARQQADAADEKDQDAELRLEQGRQHNAESKVSELQEIEEQYERTMQDGRKAKQAAAAAAAANSSTQQPPPAVS